MNNKIKEVLQLIDELQMSNNDISILVEELTKEVPLDKYVKDWYKVINTYTEDNENYSNSWITISVKVSYLVDNGLWAKYCEYENINPYAIRDWLIDSDYDVVIDEDTAIKLWIVLK